MMRPILLCAVWMLMSLVGEAQQVGKSLTTPGGLFIGFYEYKPTNYAANPTKKYPLIIFLHGSGERGNGSSDLGRVLVNGIPRNISNGSTMTFTYNGVTETFLVLSPQLSSSYGGWIPEYTDAMINYAKQNLRVDENRIFLTGLSLGGGGVWEYVTGNSSKAPQLAGVVPVCPHNYYENGIPYIVNAKLPVWAFHAIDDYTVSFRNTKNVVDGMLALNPEVEPLMTLYPSGGHGIWGRVYDESNTYHNPNIYQWMMMQGRGAAAQPNLKPIARAGSDISITLPGNSTNLNGAASSDADGPVAQYDWQVISGPANYTIVSANNSTTQFKDLVPGVYQVELKVIDCRGASSRDTVQITVNPGVGPNIPPVSEPGPDLSTGLSSIGLDAGKSYDPDGVIIAYFWKQESGPSTIQWTFQTGMWPTAANLVGGTYNVSLNVYDNLGAQTKKGMNIVNTQAILPVEYIYVRGKRSGGKNLISWATASEQNAERFEVERSEDGQVFTVIGSVPATGNSTTERSYSFTDIKAPATKMLYRLRQVDKDGKYRLSKTIILSGLDNRNPTSISFSPNPVRDQLQVQMNHDVRGAGTLRVFTMDAKLKHQEPIEKTQAQLQASLNMAEYKAGVYLVEIKIGSDYKEIQRIVKQ